jgi:hypothetical protein
MFDDASVGLQATHLHCKKQSRSDDTTTTKGALEIADDGGLRGGRNRSFDRIRDRRQDSDVLLNAFGLIEPNHPFSRPSKKTRCSTRSRPGSIKVERSYPLAEAARAHENLQSRRTSGVSIFVP